MQTILENISILNLDSLRWWRVVLTILVILGSIFYAIISLVLEKKKTNNYDKNRKTTDRNKKVYNSKKNSIIGESKEKRKGRKWFFSGLNNARSQIFSESIVIEDWQQNMPLTVQSFPEDQKAMPEDVIPEDDREEKNRQESPLDKTNALDESVIKWEETKSTRWKKLFYKKAALQSEANTIQDRDTIDNEFFLLQEDSGENDTLEIIVEESADDQWHTNKQAIDHEWDILMTQDTVTQIEQQSKTHIEREKLKTELEYLKKKQQWDKYESTLIESLAQDHHNVHVLEYLADFYMMDSQSKKALPLYKKIIEQQPDNHVFLRKMSQAYMVLQDLQTAEVLLDTALVLYPKTPKYAMSLVEIYYKTERKDRALSMMEDIVKWRPDNISYRKTLVAMYEDKGDYDKVISAYENMLLVDPTNLGLKRKLLQSRSMI